MTKPQVFGADYSVYVRIVRLCLHEKGVDYDLVPVDIFAAGGAPADYLERQPFGKIPAFEHDGFRLYETGAIVRYVDEAFSGPSLQASEPRRRARVNQIASIADSYAYPELVWGLYVELVAKVARGEATDVDRVAAARAKGQTCLSALADLLGNDPWLGGRPSLARRSLRGGDVPLFHDGARSGRDAGAGASPRGLVAPDRGPRQHAAHATDGVMAVDRVATISARRRRRP